MGSLEEPSKPPGKPRGYAHYGKEYTDVLLSCVNDRPQTTQQILRKCSAVFEEKGIDPMRSWHTVKKYLDNIASLGYIDSFRGEGIKPMTFYYKRH